MLCAARACVRGSVRLAPRWRRRKDRPNSNNNNNNNNIVIIIVVVVIRIFMILLLVIIHSNNNVNTHTDNTNDNHEGHSEATVNFLKHLAGLGHKHVALASACARCARVAAIDVLPNKRYLNTNNQLIY